ncbi:hypothetical protein CHS0354_009860, partial [Potamilus streckersoni]
MYNLSSWLWLIQNTTNKCEKPCYGKFCGVHAFALRKSSNAGTNPCENCEVGVR